MHNANPLISVVIPVYNGKGTVEECLECLYRSEFKDFEVVLVDDHSTDGSIEPLTLFPIRVISNQGERGVSCARNLGIQESRGGTVLLLDADILVPVDFLGRIHQFFQINIEASFLQGVYDSNSYYKNITSEYKNLIFAFRGYQEGKTYVPFIHAACVAGKREVFKKYSFDTRLTRREDIEYGLRLSRYGYRIYNDSDFKVCHKKRFNLATFCRYQFVAAREMITQRFVCQDKNISVELGRHQTPLYKKTWYLRPVLSGIFVLSLLGVAAQNIIPMIGLLTVISVLIIICDAPFLRYLFRFAPRKIFLLAPGLYLLDGLATAAGIVSGCWKSLMLRGKVPN